MTDRSIPERAQDVDLVEQVIARVSETDDEVAAMRRVLGVQDEADALTLAYSPEPPMEPVFQPHVDHLSHARDVIARYRAAVDSFPDDDPTPLRVRERTLRLAMMDLARLEAQ